MAMSLSLQYDPVRPLTRVGIDDRLVKLYDVFGFLYPVRHQLLQAWLVPSGSWAGLARQLHALLRGERLELTFKGRSCDYHDICKALVYEERVALKHEPLDVVSIASNILKQAHYQTQTILDRQVTVMVKIAGNESVTMADVFPQVAHQVQDSLMKCDDDNSQWLERVDCTEELRKVAGNTACVLIGQDYLSKFSRIDSLRTLTRSLHRAQDMIVCEFDSCQAMLEARAYAEQRGLGGMRFVISGEDGWRNELLDKYGIPFQLRCRMNAYKALCNTIGQQCFAQEGQLRARSRELSTSNSFAAIVERQDIDFQLRWIAYMRKDYKYLATLLSDDAMVPSKVAYGETGE